jgi:PAS domain S-box-containing protein
MTADSELLQAAVTEVARLLDADGAMVYLVDEASGELRFAHDAGITDPEAQRLIRDLTLPVGTGLFGTAVASGRLTVTDDYPADRRFVHSPVADRIVRAAGMRSMAVAPLVSGGRPIGAMGAYSSRPAAFTEAEIALLRALADHAATAIANQRLVAQLAASEARYRNLVEGSPDVVWATDASGRFTFLSETVEQLTGRRADELTGQHWSVIVAADDRDDFEARWRQSQAEGEHERRARFRIDRGGGPAVTVELRGRERLVDGRSGGAHGSLRDITDLARLEQHLRAQADELALRVETQKTLHAIAARITAIRDPDEVLQHVVDAAQRLLGSDNAHLTLRDPDRPILRPHVLAGGMDEETRAWIARLEFPIGGGMNGLAASGGLPVWTRDYLVEPRILPHSDNDLRVAERMGLRAMAVAPLRAPGGEVFGTLAISYDEPRDITDEQIELLQGLADVGAIAIANARLYEQVTESGRRYRFLVDNSPDLIFTADRDGTMTYLSETCEQLIGWKPNEVVGRHFSELIAPEAMAVVMEHWQRAREEPDRRQQYRLTLLHRDGTHLPMEINAVGTTADGEFAGAHGSVRDIRERVALENDLRRQAGELERLVDVQRTLGEIARRIAEVDDPAETLQQVVDASKRLLGSDGAHLTLLDEGGANLVPMVLAGDTDPDTRAWLRAQRFPVGGGINGLAAQTGEPIWTDDYSADPRIPHDPDDDSPSRLELGAVAVAPLRGARGEVIGTLAITYREPRAVDPRDVALLEELAGQGSIAARNADLWTSLRRQADELAHSVEAQRTLATLAAEISTIRDPGTVLRRTVEAARRLLEADHAVINQLERGSDQLYDLSPDDLSLVPGSRLSKGVGIAGAAIAEVRVRWTGDYLDDDTFIHSPQADAWIREHAYRSQMSAPLIIDEEPMGTLTVHASRPDAFGPEDAELLGALASHAAIVQNNARLYEQLKQSELRYRHLVDHSPDLVWSVDADGTFTYLGEALERMTGRRPEELVGQHWRHLITPESMPAGQAAWQAIQERPEEELQLRVELPLAGGGSMAAEVNLVATMVDGRFAGAQGSIRDIRERERLDQDLRRQAAAIAANEERANLARELHDSVTQALFSMGLTTRAMELLLDRDPPAARQKLAELRELQKDALAEMRTLIFELRPQGLETDGLAQALRNHGAAVQGRTGLSVSVEVEHEERLPLDMEESLYRIAQEALHNVVKHANADRARITLKRAGRELRLEVEDDGIGFDPSAAPRGHLGLVGMQQRAERIGGELTLSPRPGGGSRVRVTLPLARLAPAGASAASAE